MHDDTEADFLPNIDHYLNENDHGKEINLKNLEELIYIVRSKTALSYEQCEIIIKEIFANIRNEILQGNYIKIKEFGGFYIDKKKAIQFYIVKSVKNKINGK